jgi:hypothetical protein
LQAFATSAGYPQYTTCLQVAQFCDESEDVNRLCPHSCDVCNASPCQDDNAGVISLASQINVHITSCESLRYFCRDRRFKHLIEPYCPYSCEVCTTNDALEYCYDDSPALAKATKRYQFGYIKKCSQVESYCNHPKLGSLARKFCPVACNQCSCVDDDARAFYQLYKLGYSVQTCAEAAASGGCTHPQFGSQLRRICSCSCP